MSSSLSPSYQTIVSVRSSIKVALKAETPVEQRALHIAPLLSTVNLWSSQIPIMVEGPGPSPSTNLVFSIRKNLFPGAQFAQSIFRLALSELPSAFHDFLSFIHKLIEVQRGEKDKPVPKVKTFHSHTSPL